MVRAVRTVSASSITSRGRLQAAVGGSILLASVQAAILHAGTQMCELAASRALQVGDSSTTTTSTFVGHWQLTLRPWAKTSVSSGANPHADSGCGFCQTPSRPGYTCACDRVPWGSPRVEDVVISLDARNFTITIDGKLSLHSVGFRPSAKGRRELIAESESRTERLVLWDRGPSSDVVKRDEDLAVLRETVVRDADCDWERYCSLSYTGRIAPAPR